MVQLPNLTSYNIFVKRNFIRYLSYGTVSFTFTTPNCSTKVSIIPYVSGLNWLYADFLLLYSPGHYGLFPNIRSVSQEFWFKLTKCFVFESKNNKL